MENKLFLNNNPLICLEGSNSKEFNKEGNEVKAFKEGKKGSFLQNVRFLLNYFTHIFKILSVENIKKTKKRKPNL